MPEDKTVGITEQTEIESIKIPVVQFELLKRKSEFYDLLRKLRNLDNRMLQLDQEILQIEKAL